MLDMDRAGGAAHQVQELGGFNLAFAIAQYAASRVYDRLFIRQWDTWYDYSMTVLCMQNGLDRENSEKCRNTTRM